MKKRSGIDAVALTQVKPGSTVAVFGIGAVGLAVIERAKKVRHPLNYCAIMKEGVVSKTCLCF